MSDPQRQTIVNLLEHIRQEAATAVDAHSRPILVHLIGLVLEHVARFYALQLSAPSSEKDDLLLRFESLLASYYRDGLQQKLGLPTVRYCAQELFLSPNYFGDLIRQLTGDTASNIIRHAACQGATGRQHSHRPGGRAAGLRLSPALHAPVQEPFRHHPHPVCQGQEVRIPSSTATAWATVPTPRTSMERRPLVSSSWQSAGCRLK